MLQGVFENGSNFFRVEQPRSFALFVEAIAKWIDINVSESSKHATSFFGKCHDEVFSFNDSYEVQKYLVDKTVFVNGVDNIGEVLFD